MRNQKSIFRNWGDMEQGILLKIFMTLNVRDLVSSVSVVCTTWHSVCRDPILLEKISCLIFNFDIPMTDQHFIHASERTSKLKTCSPPVESYNTGWI
ncbi:hypothetical protein M0R45_024456 [Rubus argutus]|uniref:F-box domain-containing protein n=1 Tax=Rubus argutus TaxID=59490 RepID=A0AAW1WR19_RUBAR